jgi:hypothetical protein
MNASYSTQRSKDFERPTHDQQESEIRSYVDKVLTSCFKEEGNHRGGSSSGLNSSSTSSSSFYFMNRKRRTTGNKVFCGMHAISMTKNVLEVENFRSNDFITLKTDGWMYQVVISPHGIFAVGRDDRVVQLREEVATLVREQLTKGSMLAETVVDLEVIPLKDHPEGYDYLFAIFELLMFQGNSYVNKPMSTRLSILQNYVVLHDDRSFDKRTMESNSSCCDITNAKKPLVLMKVYYTLKEIHQLELRLKEINWAGCDGIMAAKRDMNYIPHTSRQLVKWKSSERNTVDFRVSVTKVDRLRVSIEYKLVDEQRKDVVYASKVVRCENEEQVTGILKKNNTIQECRWNSSQNIWVFCKTRKDKSNPNPLEIAKNIIVSIKENLTTKEIEEYINEKEEKEKKLASKTPFTPLYNTTTTTTS